MTANAAPDRMTVEIWADIVCPWCYIGKRRFEAALARFEHRDRVDVIWRSFELDPNAPARVEGSLDERLADKYGVSREEAAAMNAQVTAVAADEGLHYRLDIARPGNTFDAHRLIHFARAKGLQEQAQERLMRGYFTEGLDLGDPEALIAALAEIGIDANEARAVLESDAYAADVRADEQRAAMFGIRGVPFAVIDEAFGVSGAQSSDVFLSALQQAWAAAHPLKTVSGAEDGAFCEGADCAVPPAEAASGDDD
ncbi:MAG TPA: DsbA family oxidoreductase [Thermomicrobiales bacterium]|nr:DsbA family oxidoreductase [Thermomicrobiales bacterium]